MRIISAELSSWRGELKVPLRTARGTYAVREGWTVRLRDETGAVGLGEAVPLVEFGTESLEVSAQVLGRALASLRDRDFHPSIPAVEALLAPELAAFPAARHALELGLLDLLSRRQGLPLRRLLSAPARDEVEVNALLSGTALEQLQQARDEGLTTFKLKVGGRPLREDLARLEEVRALLPGPRYRLRVDANGAWSEAEAVEALQAFEPFALELCEQPVRAEDVVALCRVSRRVRLPVAADEALSRSVWAEALLQSASSVSIFALKPMVLGGLLPALRLAGKAHARGISSYVTSSLDGPIARGGAAQLAAALPTAAHASGLAVGTLFEGAASREPYPREGGRWQLPDTAGLGIEA